MNILRVYDKFVEAVNKNAINDNISVDYYRFLLHFRTAELKLYEEYLERRNEDDIRDIQKFLTPRFLIDSQSTPTYTSFKLPEDFFSFSNVIVKASDTKCSNKDLLTFEVKNEDVQEYLNDDNNKPSFKYRETFYTLFNDSINIYKDSFDISKVTLYYYRYTIPAEIEGVELEDGKFTINRDPEWDDKMTERIIQLAASNFLLANDENKFKQYKNNSIE